MSDTLRLLGQTCKCILFEEFTDKSDDGTFNLYDIMENAVSNKTFDRDEFYRNIENEFVIYSFDEFLRKFAPKVYEYAESVNGEPCLHYTTNAIEAKKKSARPVRIDTHPFYQMLVGMYAKKGSSGLSNLDFPEREIKKILTPAAQMEEVYDIRRRIKALARDIARAEEAGRDTQPYADAFYDCREEISERFTGSSLACLSLAITETGKRIAEAREDIKKLESAGDGETLAINTGRLGFDDDGKMTVAEIPAEAGEGPEGEPVMSLEEKTVNKLLAIVAKDVREAGPEDAFSQDLVIAVYAPPEVYSGEKADVPSLQKNVKKWEGQLEAYNRVYKQANEAFIKALVEAAQKLLCVKVFFDHAAPGGGSSARFPAGLLVANCKASKFLKNDDVRARFKVMMEHLGHEKEGRKVWLGILPDVKSGARAAAPSGNKGFDAPLRKGRADAQAAPDGSAVSLPEAMDILTIMNGSNVLTVFNFAPAADNTFAGLTAANVEKWEDLFKDYNNPHAVLAYPNFTLMSAGPVDLGGERISVPPVYVSASYVAAGLIAASQQAAALEQAGLGGSVINGNVCTRVDLEEDIVINAMPSKFNRELASSWPADIIPRINKNSFGFVFCSDPRRDLATREPLKTSYVLQARTLEQVDGRYQPVYRTLTQDFLDAYLREFDRGGEVNEDMVKSLARDFAQWRNEGTSKSSSKLNCILQDGEEIDVIDENGAKVFVVNLKSGKVSLKRRIKAQTIGDNK